MKILKYTGKKYARNLGIFLSLLILAQGSLLAQNKLKIILKNGTIDYYQTQQVSRIDFLDDNYFKVVLREATDSVFYQQTARSITFEKDPQVNNVNVISAGGWLESAFVCWDTIAGASGYKVYCKSASDSVYKVVLDTALIRSYGSYGRADVLGLVAGRYLLKVVPVGAADQEWANLATETDTLTVLPHDRSGYAHFNNREGVGAYNNDGSLKNGAVVFYITKDNCNTITHDVIVKANGATETCTGIGAILYKKQKGYDATPWAVRFIGCITDSDIDEAQLIGEKNSLQLKANDTTAAMNVTLEGVGNDATAYGWGITLYRGRSMEVRNLGIMLFQNDGIQIKASKQAWIHNCDIFYGKTGSDSDQKKGDGSMDMKDNCSYSTFSYNHFWDSGKASLCGLKESGENWLTYHHNWFDHSDSRHPRVRTMTVHVFNNYYDGVSVYGSGACLASNLFVEANYYRDTKRPMMISMQGTDVKYGEGTFSGENGGMIKAYNNVFAEKPDNFSYITHLDSPTGFDAYQAAERNEKVPSTYVTLQGGTSYSNFDTDSTLIYVYSPDAPEDVPAKVTSYAGRLQGGDFQWTFDNATDDTSYDLNEALKAALTAYKTSLSGFIF